MFAFYFDLPIQSHKVVISTGVGHKMIAGPKTKPIRCIARKGRTRLLIARGDREGQNGTNVALLYLRRRSFRLLIYWREAASLGQNTRENSIWKENIVMPIDIPGKKLIRDAGFNKIIRIRSARTRAANLKPSPSSANAIRGVYSLISIFDCCFSEKFKCLHCGCRVWKIGL